MTSSIATVRALRRSALTLLVALATTVALSGLLPASAATTGSWAAWDPLAGTAGAFTTAVDLGVVGFPAAQVTSDSRGGQVGVVSGASTWLSQGTAVGARYGTSRDQPYLNLRARADNASSPSTTTYTFATATPASGWTFVLGDIDADKVQVTAVAPDGRTLSAAELGFRGGFNYCAPGVVGKPSCTGSATDIPSWDAATRTLTGNAAALDTAGSAGWFEPTSPISSLVFTFTQRSGLPVYQTWFAALARDVSGTVTDVSPGAGGVLGGVTLTLFDPSGVVLATTTTAPDGTYVFDGVVAADGFRVEATTPTGMIAVGPLRLPVDLSETDATGVDFAVRDIVPVPVSGTVRDESGIPLAGVTVTIDDGAGGTQSVTTAADGTYLFDTVQPGTQTLTVTVPDGYALQSSPELVVVPEGSEAPVTDQDFVLVADEPTGPTTEPTTDPPTTDPPTTDPSTTEPPTGPSPTAGPTSTSPAPSTGSVAPRDPVSSGGSGPRTLADTGVEAGPLVGSGVLLVVIGCAVAAVRRRRSLG